MSAEPTPASRENSAGRLQRPIRPRARVLPAARHRSAFRALLHVALPAILLAPVSLPHQAQAYRFLGQLTVPLRVTVEGGSGSADDVVVARQVGVYGWGAGRTPPVSGASVIPLRAREDGLPEETESLRLRLSTESDPAQSLRFGQPVQVAFRRAGTEVVILDGADRCSGVRLTANPPRPIEERGDLPTGNLRDGHRRRIGHGGLPAPGPGPDVADPEHPQRTRRGRLPSSTDRPVEAGPPRMGLPVPAVFGPGRGPALLCSNVACPVFAEGEPLPPPERPVCPVSVDDGASP